MPEKLYRCSLEGCNFASEDEHKTSEHETIHKAELAMPFEVALYDSFDCEWCPLSRYATLEEAIRVCDQKTNELPLGNLQCGEYYAVFQKLANGRYARIHTGRHNEEALLEKQIAELQRQLDATRQNAK